MNTNLIIKKNNEGVSIIETLIYVAIVGILASISSVFIIDLLNSYNKTEINNNLQNNANTIMRTIENEAKFAKGIYYPISTLSVNPSQISFETYFNVPDGESSTYVDFYLSGGKLFRKTEGPGNELALNSDNIEVNSFVANVLGSTSIKFSFSLAPRFQKSAISASKSFTFTASMRGR